MTEANKEKEALITQEYLKSILEYNQETGDFKRLTNISSNARIGDIAGYVRKDGYIIISINKKLYRAHRLAWLYMMGSWSEFEVDHIDGINIPNFNKWSNLRQLTHKNNGRNRIQTNSNNSSGYRGVCVDLRNNKYYARIKINGKYKFLGYFVDAKDASIAYEAAKIIYHPMA